MKLRQMSIRREAQLIGLMVWSEDPKCKASIKHRIEIYGRANSLLTKSGVSHLWVSRKKRDLQIRLEMDIPLGSPPHIYFRDIAHASYVRMQNMKQ